MNKKERPILKNLIKEGTSELEYFQNITIRPIIKMQHDLLILSLSNYLKKRKIIIEGLSENQIKDKINAIINKDI
ncbi:MAG: glyoxalase, partial [Flavobacteriaceae bacterium]|nr:glyoxalase [Flavobacteriaceae bacterium]